MHFMNPVPIMALVELAKGLHTSQQTFEACKGLAEYLGKQVATSQDRPVSNYVFEYELYILYILYSSTVHEGNEKQL
jgi:3-hydroxyacyl-CoA dehydrogenase